MSADSKIEWTDSTFNPWIGCTKVGPGCDHCYAETLMDKRHHRVVWGAGNARSRTSAANWKLPVKWNKEPFYECRACGARGEALFMIGEHNKCCPEREVIPSRRRVFCASLADVFDNEIEREWRYDLLALIAATPNLDWQLLTKRIGNAPLMIQRAMDALAQRAMVAGVLPLPPWPWPNVWIGATIVNQEEADRDIPKLLAVPARVRFLSCEPLLGPLDLMGPLNGYPIQVGSGGPDSEPEWQQTAPPINWVIAGGESGHKARAMEPDWVRSLRDQCGAAGVPFLFKQWGEWAPDLLPRRDGVMHRVGKKAAGRLLEGRTWDGFPTRLSRD